MNKNDFKSISNTFSLLLMIAIIFSTLIPVMLVATYIVSNIKNETIKQDKIRLNSLSTTASVFFNNAIRLNSLVSTHSKIIEKVKKADNDFNLRKQQYKEKYNPTERFDGKSGLPIFCQIQKENPFIELFFLQDIKGYQVARSFDELGTRYDRWWFKHFIENEKKSFFSKSYFSITGNKPVISIFNPVVYNSQTIGILGLDINFEQIQNYVDEYMTDKNLYAIMIDNEGVIIAHPEKDYLSNMYNLKDLYKEEIVKSQDGTPILDITGFHKTIKHNLNWDKQISEAVSSVLSGSKGYIENVKIDDTTKILYYSPINFSIPTNNNKQYAILLIRDTSYIYVQRNKFIILIIASALGLSIIFYYCFKNIFHKRIISPLLKLTQYLKSYPNSTTDKELIPESNEIKIIHDIFQNLIESIDKKRKDLETYKVNLEKIVSERTEQLELTNKNLTEEMHQRQQAYKEVLRLKTAIEQLAVAVVITNLEGEIIFANSSFENITGYTVAESLGEHTRILKSGKHSKEFYKTMWDKITSGWIWENELINKKKDGSLYWEKMIITPVKNDLGKILYFIAIKEDVTEKKELNDKLKIAIERAESSNKAKNSFLANVSHEIRTPMNAVVGFANLLSTTSLNDKQKLYIEKIKSASDSLMQILDNILYIAKIESGDFKIEPVDFNINEELSYISTKIKQELRNKNIDVIIYKDPMLPDYLYGDNIRLQQALLNIGYNSVKFTQTGTITISISLLQKKGDKVFLRYSISDTGIGISANKIDQIYNYFSPADDTTTKKHSGVGLGLSITKKIISMMGGEIGVKSMPGQGSIFYFSLWLEISKINNLQINTTKSNNDNTIIKEKIILVVDDNEINREVAFELLSLYNFKIDMAASGKEAIEKTKNNRYDLILMDIYMPELDGVETTNIIRKDYDMNELPILALTASIMPEEIKVFKNSGMNDVIIKPIEAKQLYDIISRYLKDIDFKTDNNNNNSQDEISGNFDNTNNFNNENESDNNISNPQNKNNANNLLNNKVSSENNFPKSKVIDESKGIDTTETIITELKNKAPFLSIEIGIRRLSNNVLLYLNILKKFNNNHSGDADKLKEALKNKDINTIESILHTLKGLTGSIGAFELNKTIRNVNKPISIKDSYKEIEHVINELNDFFNKLSELEVLKTEYSINNANKKDFSIEHFRTQLNELKKFLESNDTRSIKIIEEINQSDVPDKWRAEINKISFLLGQYKMKDALSILNKIFENNF